jgi:hypothetical protein
VACEKCGVELRVGDWPFCPHGGSRWHVDAFEPYFDENLTVEGVWITSATQRRKIMDDAGVDFLADKDRRHSKRSGAAPVFFDLKR